MPKLECSGSLLYPPTVNHLWIRSGNRVFKSPKAQKFYHDCVLFLRTQNPTPVICERVAVEFDVFPPDRKKRDIDNLAKALNDVLVLDKLIKDDFNIELLVIKRCAIVKGGRIDFRISEIDDAEVFEDIFG